MLSALRCRLTLLLASLSLAACVVYEPVPVSAPSQYDRVWSAALGAMQDAGVSVSSADPASGRIRGSRNGVPAAVDVLRQADGSVQVRFDSKDAQLAELFKQTYARRMGR
ncbi:MAG: hypothetical protein REI94_08335 [Moraxellaceae bacterium]|nr:hypothetical protein [Moraxellaceae bacterium]